jgi:hypothetical protein
MLFERHAGSDRLADDHFERNETQGIEETYTRLFCI